MITIQGKDLGKDPHSLLKIELRESLLGGEILDPHLMTGVGPDLHPLVEDTQTPFGKDR